MHWGSSLTYETELAIMLMTAWGWREHRPSSSSNLIDQVGPVSLKRFLWLGLLSNTIWMCILINEHLMLELAFPWYFVLCNSYGNDLYCVPIILNNTSKNRLNKGEWTLVNRFHSVVLRTQSSHYHKFCMNRMVSNELRRIDERTAFDAKQR